MERGGQEREGGQRKGRRLVGEGQGWGEARGMRSRGGGMSGEGSEEVRRRV